MPTSSRRYYVRWASVSGLGDFDRLNQRAIHRLAQRGQRGVEQRLAALVSSGAVRGSRDAVGVPDCPQRRHEVGGRGRVDPVGGGEVLEADGGAALWIAVSAVAEIGLSWATAFEVVDQVLQRLRERRAGPLLQRCQDLLRAPPEGVGASQ